mmetsp:Transcript_19285/g.64649  ORF Transcript_19285/g.64649 Transcript_19285/m.64649 type:complete len:206 (-) Transcript_19285:928-1545(-)
MALTISATRTRSMSSSSGTLRRRRSQATLPASGTEGSRAASARHTPPTKGREARGSPSTSPTWPPTRFSWRTAATAASGSLDRRRSTTRGTRFSTRDLALGCSSDAPTQTAWDTPAACTARAMDGAACSAKRRATRGAGLALRSTASSGSSSAPSSQPKPRALHTSTDTFPASSRALSVFMPAASTSASFAGSSPAEDTLQGPRG